MVGIHKNNNINIRQKRTSRRQQDKFVDIMFIRSAISMGQSTTTHRRVISALSGSLLKIINITTLEGWEGTYAATCLRRVGLCCTVTGPPHILHNKVVSTASSFDDRPLSNALDMIDSTTGLLNLGGGTCLSVIS